MGSDGGSAGPVEVEPMPGYWELLSRGSSVMLGAWRDCRTCGLELSRQTLLENAYITWTEIALFFFCAVLWTMVRRALTESLFKVGVPFNAHTRSENNAWWWFTLLQLNHTVRKCELDAHRL